MPVRGLQELVAEQCLAVGATHVTALLSRKESELNGVRCRFSPPGKKAPRMQRGIYYTLQGFVPSFREQIIVHGCWLFQPPSHLSILACTHYTICQSTSIGTSD